jgi:hypothetical protein
LKTKCHHLLERLSLVAYCATDPTQLQILRTQLAWIQHAVNSTNVYKLVARENSSIDNFKRDIRRTKPSIIYFTGHGSKDENAICFVGSSGEYERLNVTELVEVLGNAQRERLKLTFLNCWLSALQWDLLADVAPVIAMEETNTFGFELDYAGTLDDKVAKCKSIKTAYAETEEVFAENEYSLIGQGMLIKIGRSRSRRRILSRIQEIATLSPP